MKGTQLVHIICWDNFKYDREASFKEVLENRKLGFVRETGNELTFDFRGRITQKNIQIIKFPISLLEKIKKFIKKSIEKFI